MARRKRNRNFTAIPVKMELALAALADNTVLTGDLLGTLGRGLYVVSADLTWSLRDKTAGQGPINVGICHGDYSVTEVAEALSSWTDPDDKIATEKARRLVRRVGVFSGNNSTEESLNDGKPIRTKVKIAIGDGQSLKAFALNDSGAALTTGSILQCYGMIYGRWNL